MIQVTMWNHHPFKGNYPWIYDLAVTVELGSDHNDMTQSIVAEQLIHQVSMYQSLKKRKFDEGTE